MNEPAPPADTAKGPVLSMKTTFLLALVVCGLAISAQSYWIDEGDTAYISGLPTLHDWWQFLRANGNAMLQVPLYQIFSWGWEKLLGGADEWLLRSSNVLWFVPGAVLLGVAFAENRRLQASIMAVLFVSPFVWFYLDEARPYAMQIGASLAVFGSLYRLASPALTSGQERMWVRILCFAAVLLAGSGMLAMLWLGAYLGAAALSSSVSRLRLLAKAHALCWIITGTLLLALGGYYLWTISLGARASLVGDTSWKSCVYIFYELLGFSGLGPGRSELRKTISGLVRSLPWLALYGAPLLVVMIAGSRTLWATQARRTSRCWSGALVLVLGFLITVGFATHFRVLGRHCTPLLPLLLLILGSGISTLAARRTLSGRAVVSLLLGMSLVSCLMLRFSPVHAKENYRQAAEVAREALMRRQVVWWSAAGPAGYVYGVPLFRDSPLEGAAFWAYDASDELVGQLPVPDVILMSKPETFDQLGAVGRYVNEHGYRAVKEFAGFIVWRRPQD